MMPQVHVDSSLIAFGSLFDHARMVGNIGTNAITSITSDLPLSENTYEYWDIASGVSYYYFEFDTAIELNSFGLVLKDRVPVLQVQLERSSDGITYTVYSQNVGITADTFMLIRHQDASSVYWRLKFTAGTAGTKLAVLKAGEAITFERKIWGGHNPSDLNPQYKTLSNVSENGQFLGRYVVQKGYQSQFQWNNLSKTFVYDEFAEWFDYLASSTVFIAWRPLSYPTGAMYGWTTAVPQVSNSGPAGLHSISMSLRGYRSA